MTRETSILGLQDGRKVKADYRLANPSILAVALLGVEPA
jgi:hypothetical protein